MRPFSDQQIRLLETFADQAVIAIENARLFSELEQRNRALSESLERQTATAEVLRVIASAPTDLPRILETLAERAYRLCGATGALVWLVDGDLIRCVAVAGTAPATLLGATRPMSRGHPIGRTIIEGRVLHIDDVHSPESRVEFPDAFQPNIRTTLSVPLLRDGKAIGGISSSFLEVRPFTEAQVALLETFADQAVIAIENARLFTELEQRNAELSQALEQQTATAEVLRVIASAPTDIDVVLQSVTRSAARLCEANTIFWRREGEHMRAAAAIGDVARRIVDAARHDRAH